MKQQQSTAKRNVQMENLQERTLNRGVHSKFQEHSWNSLGIVPTTRKGEPMQMEGNTNRDIHSEFTEHPQHSLGTLNIGKSRVQATDRINSHQVPLTGYKDFRQDLQMYPVSREPVMEQPTGSDSISSSALLDLPNINTNLPPPLVLQANQTNSSPNQQLNQTGVTTTRQVTNSEILKSIQSIT